MHLINANATYNNTPYGASNNDNMENKYRVSNSVKYRDLSSDDSELNDDNGNYAPVPYE